MALVNTYSSTTTVSPSRPSACLVATSCLSAYLPKPAVYGLRFCATGLNGLKRSLTAQEIVDQVLHVSNDFGERATSVVFMGQGEPFANYDEVLKALRILNDPDGIGIGARHLTVSTSGVIPGIRKFADIPEQFTLAVSLHSAIQSTRNKLMPGVRSTRFCAFTRPFSSTPKRPAAVRHTNTP